MRNTTPVRGNLPMSPAEALQRSSSEDPMLVIGRMQKLCKRSRIKALFVTLGGTIFFGWIDEITDLVVAIDTGDKSHPAVIEIERISHAEILTAGLVACARFPQFE